MNSQLVDILFSKPTLLSDPRVIKIKQIFATQRTRLQSLEETRLQSVEETRLLFLELPFNTMVNNTPEAQTPAPAQVTKLNITVPPPNYYNSSNNFASWLKTLKRYFAITGTTTNQQPGLFLYYLGELNSQKLENFYRPPNPEKTLETLTFDELIVEAKKLWEAVGARQSANDFFSHTQGAEPIQVFAEKLQQLAVLAGFQNNEKVMNDKFISGIRDQKIRYELLQIDAEAHFDTILKKQSFWKNFRVNKTIKRSTKLSTRSRIKSTTNRVNRPLQITQINRTNRKNPTQAK